MTGTTSVLLVEDDLRLGNFTAEYLTKRGLVVEHKTDGESALQQLRQRPFDIVILDVMLPGRDGLSVCRAIRESSDIPILLVTARGEETDRILGFEVGADDYIVKPFLPRELLARIQAFVRRHRGALVPRGGELRVGPLRVDSTTMAASLEGHPLNLSPTEYQLLVRLMERPGRVLTRDHLLELMKGSADEAFDRAIDVQISRLRQKLGDRGSGSRLIKTVRGIGYMLVPESK